MLSKHIKNVSFVSVSFFYVNILGYVFHFYVSRYLGPADYGEFMVLYSILCIMGNIGSLISTASIKIIIESSPFELECFRYLRKVSFYIGLGTALLMFLGSSVIKKVLNLNSIVSLWIIAICCFTGFIVLIEKSLLQAKEKFGSYSLANSLELTIRFLSVFLFIYLNLKVEGIIGASLVGLIGSLLFLISINKNFKGNIKKVSLKKLILLGAFIFPGNFFIYADNVFVKKIFDSQTAGIFGSISILGKALIWFCITIFSVFFPRLIKIKSLNLNNFKILFIKTILIISCIFILAELIVNISYGKVIFVNLFGDKFILGYKYLKTYILCIYPLVLVLICIYIFTIIQKYLKIIYIHLILYYILLALFPVQKIKFYIFYIGLINTLFLVLYLILILKFKPNFNSVKV